MMHRKQRQRLVAVALALALIASLSLSSASGLAMVDQDVLVNGNFEGGFSQQTGCGMVGTGWGCFTNGGTAAYGFYDDQWDPVVADGDHSQLIEINTLQYPASEADRYAGIYQKVHLVKGATYTLKVTGLMRERGPDPFEDKFRYRVQWGYTADGSTDWTTVSNWVELPWDKIDERTAPTGMESFSTSLKAPSSHVTVFFRVWKKWGTPYRELDVNLDAISLVGKAPRKPGGPGGVVVLPPVPPDPGVPPVTGDLVCAGPNLLANGDFEGGFLNGVGKGWSSFNNGGSAAYGFYDEMWAPVVKDGIHGQLIEINTWGLAASDADRVAGILQVVDGLAAGATYEFSLWGMLREEAAHPDEDMYRYRVQWGYAAADADPAVDDVTNWTDVPWDTIYVRTAPGTMSSHSVRLQAPAGKMVLAVRALKKWGTAYRELDVNVDAIKLVPCTGAQSTCIHIVARGHTLSAIARYYGTTVAHLAQLNGLKNPNLLIVGQKLQVPCKGAQPPIVVPPPPPPPPPPPDDDGTCITYTVVRGDSLFKLALRFNTTVAAIAEMNNLKNPNLIFVGQQLKICDP